MWGLGLGVGVVGWWCVLVVVLVVLWGGSGFVGWYWVVIGCLGWLVGWCGLDGWWCDGGYGWWLCGYCCGVG